MKFFGVDAKMDDMLSRSEYRVNAMKQIDEYTISDWFDVGKFLDEASGRVILSIEFNRRYKGTGCKVYLERADGYKSGTYEVFLSYKDDRTDIVVYKSVLIEKDNDRRMADIVQVWDPGAEPEPTSPPIMLCKCMTIPTVFDEAGE